MQPSEKIQNLVWTFDLDSQGSIYPLRVRYEALLGGGLIFEVFCGEAYVAST